MATTNPDGLGEVDEARKVALVLASLIPADEVDRLADSWSERGWVPWFTEAWFDERVGHVTRALDRRQ